MIGKEKPAYLEAVERLIGRCIIKLATSDNAEINGWDAVIDLARNVQTLSLAQQAAHDPLNATYFQNILVSDEPPPPPRTGLGTDDDDAEEADDEEYETSKSRSSLPVASTLARLVQTQCDLVSCCFLRQLCSSLDWIHRYPPIACHAAKKLGVAVQQQLVAWRRRFCDSIP